MYLVPNFCSSQNKRQHAKKINLERPKNTNVQPNDDSNSDPSNLPKDSILDSDQEMDSDDHIPIIIKSGYSKETGYNNSSQPNEVTSLHNDTVDSTEGSSHSNDENMSSSFPSNDIPVCPKFFSFQSNTDEVIKFYSISTINFLLCCKRSIIGVH